MKFFGSRDVRKFDGAITAFDAQRRGGAYEQARGAEPDPEVGLNQRFRTTRRLIAVFAATITVLALSACNNKDSKTYDISPIFPLSSDKCAKYDGKVDGQGITSHCYVTKAKCEQAAADWRQAMQQGGVTDAIQFSCN